MYSPTDDVITQLARQLRSHGQGMLRGDYSLVPTVQELIVTRAAEIKARSAVPGPPRKPGAHQM